MSAEILPKSAGASSMPHPYGWRAKIGLIVPSPNTVNETEFWRMAPEGVTIHTTRLLFEHDSPDPLDAMDRHLPMVLRELAGAEVDVIAYGCTASSVKKGPETIIKAVEADTGIPTTATAGAILDALAAVGAKKIAFGTPYPQSVNDHERQFFEDAGFAVTQDASLIVSEEQQRLKHMCLVPTDRILEMIVGLDTPDTDAVFVSCTDFASLPTIEPAEQRIGKPVITSTQALFWQTLRKAGIDDRLDGYGMLLRDH